MAVVLPCFRRRGSPVPLTSSQSAVDSLSVLLSHDS